MLGTILTLTGLGINLACVYILYRMVKKLQKENQSLRQENIALNATVDNLWKE